jgi:4-hydroxybenzoate polyprenyltransferase
LIYHAGYAANGGGGDVRSFGIFAGVMALWMGLVGQTKDLSDIEGDKQAGRKSAPVVWGEDAARLALSGVALFLGGGNVALALLLAPDLLLEALTLMLGALAVAAVSMSSWSRGDRARRRRPYRAFMLAQYGTHLATVIW